MADLAWANCITDTSLIYAGDILLVPPGVTPNFNLPLGASPDVSGCNTANAIISSPRPGATLEGFTILQGTAGGDGFQRYILGWRAGSLDAGFNAFVEIHEPRSGELGGLNTDELAPGTYWLSVYSFGNNGILGECSIRVTFR